MGTWGTGPFENDEASDWAYELEKARDLSVLREALSKDPLEAPEGVLIVAAAEVLAVMGGKSADELSPEVASWVERQRKTDYRELLELARRGLDRVLATESELRELWAENQELYPAWEASVRELRALLAE